MIVSMEKCLRVFNVLLMPNAIAAPTSFFPPLLDSLFRYGLKFATFILATKLIDARLNVRIQTK